MQTWYRWKFFDMRRWTLATLCLASPAAFAQCPEDPSCSPCDSIALDQDVCNDTDTLANSGSTWQPGSPDWTPDRRPAALIVLRTGQYCEEGGNPRGFVYWWAGDDQHPEDDLSSGDQADVFSELMTRMDCLIADGWRRIVLKEPAGSPARTPLVANAQWYGMSQWRRDAFESEIAPWLSAHRINGEDIDIEIYGGFRIDDPYSICMSCNAFDDYTVCDDGISPCGDRWQFPCENKCPAWDPLPWNSNDTCNFRTNVVPWMNVGIRKIWFDGCSGYTRRPLLFEFIYSPDYFNSMSSPKHAVQFGGEAYPTNSGGSVVTADFSKAPFLAWEGVVEGYSGNGSWDFWSTRSSTEVTMVSSGSSAGSLDETWDYVSRGFVMVLNDADNVYAGCNGSDLPAERLKMVYDFGTLQNALDFDASGWVDLDDYDRYHDMWDLYHGTSNRNFVHGDVDGDHDVDSADAALFDYKFANDTVWQLDLHESNPDYAVQ